MKVFFSLFILSFNIFAYDSFNAHEYKVSIEDGIILTKNPSNVLAEIKEQIKYLTGTFLEFDGGFDWINSKIIIKNTEQIDDTFSKINYEVQSYASISSLWYKNSMTAILPSRGDQEGLQNFSKLYEKNCSTQITGITGFWYYYRPLSAPCLITQNLEALTSVNISFSTTDRQASDKTPNYTKIWKDRKFEMTIMFTKNHENDQQGAGIDDYNDFYLALLENLGDPTYTSSQIDHVPGASNPELHLHFRKVIVHLFLIDNLNRNTDTWFEKLNQYIPDSDFVSYSGHAGLGINTAHLVNRIEFKKNKYQILFFNSCATYGNLSDDIYLRRKTLNPKDDPTKFLDIISNSTRNYFGTYAQSNIIIINKILEGELSFREIFAQLPINQFSALK